MSSIHTNDLLSQKSQLQAEMLNLEKSLAEKRVLLWFLDTLIKQSQQRDSETLPNKSQYNNTPITTSRPLERDFQSEIRKFLLSQSSQSARTSMITDALSWWTRDGQQKVSNALNQLIKSWEVEIIKEYDSTGAERQRNRLYQLTSLV